MDVERFWKDDDLAHEDNCFSEKAPQVALGLRMSDECVFAELGEQGDPWGWGHEDPARRLELNRRYNDKAEKIVGKRLLAERDPASIISFPYVKRIGEVFGGVYEWPPNTGEWLRGSAGTPQELEKLLDRVDALDIESFILPPDWEREKRRIFEETGIKPDLMRHIRGPVTLAASIFGVENLVFLFYDEPDLFARFSRSILRVVLAISAVMDREAGFTPDNRPSGFSFADDDCCLLTPEMYEIFGYPILKEVFSVYSPEPGDKRYQHSDSAMGHLLPLLGTLSLTGCNFGPTVLVPDIRAHMPRTRIDGCLAPFTFMRNDMDAIRNEVKRDCLAIKTSGTRGLNLFTAGSINNGSSLEGLLVVMETIQEFGRY